MTDIIETRLNDVVFSAKSCSFNIAFAPFVGITALDYSETRERAMVWGARRDGTPLGITSGKYSVDSLSMTMLRSSYQRLAEVLSVQGLGSIGDAIFPIVATYSEPLALAKGVLPITIDIQGARITGVKDSYAEGTDALVTEVTMMAMQVRRNGLQLFSLINGIGP